MYFRTLEMKTVFWACLLSCTCSIGGAAAQSTHAGLEALHQLKDGWLIVRLPAYTKKITTIDSLLDGDLSDKNRARLQSLYDEAIADRHLIQTWYPIAFDSLYTFSNYAFITMHETEDFESGKVAARRSDGSPVQGLQNAYYLYGTLQGVEGGRFEFTFADHSQVPAPLPAYISMSGPLIPGILNIQKSDWIRDLDAENSRVYRTLSHVSRINRILHKHYQRRIIAGGYHGPATDQ